MVLLFARSSSIFDGPAPGGLFSIGVSMNGDGLTRAGADAASQAARIRALALLAKQGFDARTITEKQRLATFSTGPNETKTFHAFQSFDVGWPTYAKVARLSNAIDRRNDPLITGAFPPITFCPFAITVGVVYMFLLMFSGVALETREADASHAPRGMHPLFVALQTVFLGTSMALAVVYAHLLADAATIPFVILTSLGALFLGYWLWKTRPWFGQSGPLRIAWILYVCAWALTIVADAVALCVPMT